jgi:NAD(P)-dependent dehydrogenase (short-subunit alcohol dehydrogenase family)
VWDTLAGVAEVDLSQRVIVVTGASRGLGAGLADWFAARGARVGLCARTKPDFPTGTQGDARAVSVEVDMTDDAAVEAFAETVTSRLGPPDLWINNAGVLDPIVPQRDLTPGALLDHLNINVVGVLNGTRAYLRELEQVDASGALVNISSGAAVNGRAGWSAYCAAKAAVDRLSEALAVEEPDRLPVVLSVYPGLIETGMQELIRSQSAEVQPDVEWFRDRHRSGAMNTPAWVAETIAGWVFGGQRPEAVIAKVPDNF